jgi:hypothetical protein
VALENTQHVAQDAERHQVVDAALVLEQQINERPRACSVHGKEKIRLCARKLVVYVAPGLECQRREIQPRQDFGWQYAPELRGGVFDASEGVPEERVVRIARFRRFRGCHTRTVGRGSGSVV